MYIKRNISFYLLSNPSGDAKTGLNRCIRMRLRFNGNAPIDINTGYHTDAVHWDATRQRMKTGTQTPQGHPATEVNAYLVRITNTINEAFVRYETIDCRIPDRGEIIHDIRIHLGLQSSRRQESDNPEREVALRRLVALFIKEESSARQWTPSTNQKFGVLTKHLLSFRPSLSIDEIDDKLVSEFILYLTSKGKQRNVTVNKTLSNLKWFLRWAHRRGYYKGSTHLYNNRIKGLNTKEVIYLSKEELIAIRDFNGTPAQNHVRDMFLFCCYTGLRYSDMSNLLVLNVTDGKIEIVSQKTSKPIKIELNSYAQELVDRYSRNKRPTQSLFNAISNQKYNDALHDIARLAGLNSRVKVVYYVGSERIEEVLPKHKLITSHCARRTFVVNGLRLGIPAEVMMRWTGHSNFAAMKPYMDIVDELKRKEMNKFEGLFD